MVEIQELLIGEFLIKVPIPATLDAMPLVAVVSKVYPTHFKYY